MVKFSLTRMVKIIRHLRRQVMLLELLYLRKLLLWKMFGYWIVFGLGKDTMKNNLTDLQIAKITSNIKIV